jgi:5-formyltetrahydrofolate cyclo-ligase
MTKSELRKIYLSKQRETSPEDRVRDSQRISDRFFDTIDLASIKVVHCFISIEKFNEIDTAYIYERLWREFPKMITAVPRVNRDRSRMDHLRFASGTELLRSSWDIDEPVHEESVDIDEIDLVLIPLVCFDRAGNRIGYGKGFYDRFLAECRSDCTKVGLSYFPPVERIDDAGQHDIRLDRCITPDETFDVIQTAP